MMRFLLSRTNFLVLAVSCGPFAVSTRGFLLHKGFLATFLVGR